MDDLDSSIQLNLFTGNFSTSEKRQIIKGNRGSRIKERKQLKRLARFEKEAKEGTESADNVSQNVEESDNLEVKQTKQKRKSSPEKSSQVANKKFKGQQAQSQVFISSLFKYNPSIPEVEKLSVKSKKETVFSQSSFKELDLHQFMISNLEERLKLNHMTAVQQQAIPSILNGHDVLVKSQTGTGKTLTFAIPIVQKLQESSPKIQRSDGIHAVIVVPTRELAIQCHETFVKLVYPFQWIVPGCLMGGEKRKSEKARLRKGINILVATPGRLLDHAEHTNNLSLTKVKWLVFDEADRMLDMGYEKDVAKIINILNKDEESERQTILLSATLTEGVERLAGMSLQHPIKVDVSMATDEAGNQKQLKKVPIHEEDKTENFVVPEKLKQHFVITPCKLRLVTLAAFILLKGKMIRNPGKIVVFLSTQDSVDFHFNLFQRFLGDISQGDVEEKLDFYKLHGEMGQKDRTKVYQDFCKASRGVLLCTDVASRGLHLPQVRWIVQYTTPGAATDYIHRVGRTARVGKQGHSLLFLMPSEVEYIKVLASQNISMEEIQMNGILKTLILAVQDIHIQTEIQRMPPKTLEESSTYLQMCFENYLTETSEALNMAKKAYQSFVRAYATYPLNLKSIFRVKNLHLGHLAKSFGLRDAPSNIASLMQNKNGSKGKFQKFQRNKAHSDGRVTPKKTFSSFNVSEFSSGLQKGIMSSPHVKKGKKKKKK